MVNGEFLTLLIITRLTGLLLSVIAMQFVVDGLSGAQD